MKDFKFNEWLLELTTFLGACLIVGFGVSLATYYLATEPSIVSVLVGLVGMGILYPAFKTWQERIKRMF